MNDPRRTESSDPTQQAGNGYPPNPDPAYAGQYYGYGAPYTGPGYVLHRPAHRTTADVLAAGGYQPTEPPQPPPGPPKSPRWLWILAAVAVLLVVGLVIALVIVTSSSRSPRSQCRYRVDRDQYGAVDPDGDVPVSRCHHVAGTAADQHRGSRHPGAARRDHQSQRHRHRRLQRRR